MSRNTNALMAFLLGAAVGGITALLLAPDKGETTRRRLREGGVQGLRRGKDRMAKAATSLEDAARVKGEAVSEAARRRVDAARAAFAEAKDAYRRELDKS